MAEFCARGKVVVVTGGANGIGAALCRRFASEGASKVVVVDLNLGVAQALAATLPDHVGVAMGAGGLSALHGHQACLALTLPYPHPNPHAKPHPHPSPNPNSDRVGVAMGADCGSELDLRRVIVQTEFEHGPIAVFVANAGIPSNGSNPSPSPSPSPNT